MGDPRTWWHDALDQLAARPLALRPEHVAELYTLPPLHKDPFDRILIAQATAEELTLITTDGEIPRYASLRLRVSVTAHARSFCRRPLHRSPAQNLGPSEVAGS